MDSAHLLAKFARIGARLKVADRPSRRFRAASGVISLDIGEDRDGEFFEVARRPGVDPEVAVLDVQPADRHLLLLVRETGGRPPLGEGSCSGRKGETACHMVSDTRFLAIVPSSAMGGSGSRNLSAISTNNHRRGF